MQIELGLVAAVCYGTADFFGGLASKRSDACSIALTSRLVSLLLLVAALPVVPAHFYRADVAWGVGAGLCGAGAIALLYRALAIGKMGALSAVTAGIAATVPAIFSAVRGDHVSAAQWVGVSFALYAIVVVSGSFNVRTLKETGAAHAFVSGCLFGVAYICLGQSHKDGGLQTLLAARVSSLAVLTVAAILTGFRLRSNSVRYVLGAGVLDTAANLSYVAATLVGSLAVAAVVASLYPATTMLLARLSQHERLTAGQWSGVAFAVAGVALIAMRP